MSSHSSCFAVKLFIAVLSLIGSTWAGQEDQGAPATHLHPQGQAGIWQSKDADAKRLGHLSSWTWALQVGTWDPGCRCCGLLRGLPSKASSNEAAGVSCATRSDVTDTSGRITAEQAVKDTWGLMDPSRATHATNHPPKIWPKGHQGSHSRGKPSQPELLLTFFPTHGTGFWGLSHLRSP